MTYREIKENLRKSYNTGKRVRVTCKDGVQGECVVLQMWEEHFTLDPSPELVKAYDWEGWGSDVCIDYDELAAAEFVD